MARWLSAVFEVRLKRLAFGCSPEVKETNRFGYVVIAVFCVMLELSRGGVRKLASVAPLGDGGVTQKNFKVKGVASKIFAVERSGTRKILEYPLL